MTTTPTHTSSRQPSPPRLVPPKTEEARPPLPVMLAVCAIVVSASAFAWILVDRNATGHGLPKDATRSDAAQAIAYEADPMARLANLSAVQPIASGADLEAPTRALQDAQASAAQSLDAAVTAARQALDEAIANASLPAPPEGYVSGMDVVVHVPAPEGYDLPALPTVPSIDALSLTGVAGSPSPVGSRGGDLLSLTEVLAQLDQARTAIEGVTGTLPVDGLPLGALGGGLPVGGPSSSTVPDPQGTVTPDEQGANLADLHADSLLTATSAAYGQAHDGLAGLLTAYGALSDQVEQAIADTRALQDETKAGIEATLEQRLADIEAQALDLEAKANQLAATQTHTVSKAQAEAQATVNKTLRAQVGAIQGATDGAEAELEAQVRAVQDNADARQAEIAALVDSVAADLSKPGAPADAAQRFDAVQTAAAAAIAKVSADAKAKIASLEQAAAKLQADSRAAVAALQDTADEARGQINGTVANALSGGLEAKSYLVQVARAQADASGKLESQLAATTLSHLDSVADDHVKGLVRSGLKAVDAADPVLAETQGLVGKVDDLAGKEVGKDVGYMQKVSDDYSKVPTDDRRERAGHWATAAGEIQDTLGETLAAGQSLEGLAARTLQAAHEAKAAIAAMA